MASPFHAVTTLSSRAGCGRVVRAASSDGLELSPVEGFAASPGGGVSGRVAGRRVAAGSERFLADQGVVSTGLTAEAQAMRKAGATAIFVTHDQEEALTMSDRIAVMRGGAFVEVGDAERVLRQPQHAYTKELLAAVPELPELIA